MMRAAGIVQDLAAVFLLASFVIAGAVAVIRKARARGKRKFVTEPNQRLRGLHPDTRIDHRWDA